MRVPGIVFASRSLLPRDQGDMALIQVVNVATLPGIVRASYAMPDVHWGYGFPIGGVAATDIDNGGVVSPGGVGFDISCGVRLLVGSELDRDRLQPRLPAVMDRARPSDTARCGYQGGVAAAQPRGVAASADWWCPVRGGTGTRRRAGPRAVRRRRRNGRSGRGRGQRPGGRTRARADRQPRLGQPLPGSPGRRPRLRSGRGRAAESGRRHGLRHDPHRLAWPGTPDLHRPRPAHGACHGPLRHFGARPPIGVRAGALSRWPGVSRGNGRRGKLRARQPATTDRGNAPRFRGRNRYSSGYALRRVAQPGEDRGARDRRSARALCACTAKVRPAHCRRIIANCRPIWQRSVNQCSYRGQWARRLTSLPGSPTTRRSFPPRMAPGGCRAVTRRPAIPAARRYVPASHNAASSFAALPAGGSPRKNPRRTRTSMRSSKPAIIAAWRAKSLAWFRWGASKDESNAELGRRSRTGGYRDRRGVKVAYQPDVALSLPV